MHPFTHLCHSCWTVIVTMQLRGCLFCTEGHFALWQHKHAIVVEVCAACSPFVSGSETATCRSRGLRYLRGWVCIPQCSARTRGLIEGRGSKAMARRMRQENGLIDCKRSWFYACCAACLIQLLTVAVCDQLHRATFDGAVLWIKKKSVCVLQCCDSVMF